MSASVIPSDLQNCFVGMQCLIDYCISKKSYWRADTDVASDPLVGGASAAQSRSCSCRFHGRPRTVFLALLQWKSAWRLAFI